MDRSWRMRSESCLHFTDECECQVIGYLDVTPCPRQYCDGPDAPPLPYESQLDEYGVPLVSEYKLDQINQLRPSLHLAADSSSDRIDHLYTSSSPAPSSSNITLSYIREQSSNVSPGLWIMIVIILLALIAALSELVRST